MKKVILILIVFGSSLMSCTDETSEEVFENVELSTNDPDEDPGGDTGG